VKKGGGQVFLLLTTSPEGLGVLSEKEVCTRVGQGTTRFRGGGSLLIYLEACFTDDRQLHWGGLTNHSALENIERQIGESGIHVSFVKVLGILVGKKAA